MIADVRMSPTHTDEGIRAALVIRGQWPDIGLHPGDTGHRRVLAVLRYLGAG